MMKWILILTAAVTLAACSTKETKPAAETPKAEEKAATKTETPSAAAKAPDKKESALAPRGIDFGAVLEDIALSCCADQDAPQSMWKTINSHQPDMFLFIGNTVYLKPDEKSLAAQYRRLHHNADYRAIREKVPFMVTWDNEEYNDGKDSSKKEFLREWSYIQDSLVLGQSGIYHAKIIGPKHRQVQIIMLDTHTFRSPLTKAPDFNPETPDYVPNNDAKATVLGEEQWSWLEEQLKRPAQMRIIVSSMPVIATEAPLENWGLFPLERQRFFDLLKKTQAHNLIVASGDSEIGAIAKTDIKNWGTLYDITAGPVNMPTQDNESDPAFVDKGIGAQNFGLIHIDWGRHQMHLEIRNESNKVVSSANAH